MKLKCDEPLSKCAFKFNLRHYIEAFIVAKPRPPLLTAEEQRWLAAASTCKNCAIASKRTVCAAFTYADDAKGAWDTEAGRRRLTVSKPVLNAHVVSTLDTEI